MNKGKKVAFIGAGVSHKTLIREFVELGAHVTLCDQKKSVEDFGDYAATIKELGIDLSLGENYLDGFMYANPRHPYTRALLSAVPIPDPEVKKERITLKGDLPSPSNPPSGCLFHTRCPHCTEKCKTQVPTPVEIAPGHIVKCHYPELTE